MKINAEHVIKIVMLTILGLMSNGCGIITKTHNINVIPEIKVWIHKEGVSESSIVILDDIKDTMEAQISLGMDYQPVEVSGNVVLSVNGMQYGPREISAGETVNFRIPISPGKVHIKVQFEPFQRKISRTMLWKRTVYEFNSHQRYFTFYPVYIESVGVGSDEIQYMQSYPIKYSILGNYDSVSVHPSSIYIPENYNDSIFQTEVVVEVYKGMEKASKSFVRSYKVSYGRGYMIKWVCLGSGTRCANKVKRGQTYNVIYDIRGHYDSVRVYPDKVSIPSSYVRSIYFKRIKIDIYRDSKKSVEYFTLRHEVAETPPPTCGCSVFFEQYSFTDKYGKDITLRSPVTYNDGDSIFHVSVIRGVPFTGKVSGLNGWQTEDEIRKYEHGIVNPESLVVRFHAPDNRGLTCKGIVYINPTPAIDLGYLLYVQNISSFKVCASGEEIPFTSERYVFVDMGRYGKYELESGGVLKKRIDGCIRVRLEKWR